MDEFRYKDTSWNSVWGLPVPNCIDIKARCWDVTIYKQALKFCGLVADSRCLLLYSVIWSPQLRHCRGGATPFRSQRWSWSRGGIYTSVIQRHSTLFRQMQGLHVPRVSVSYPSSFPSSFPSSTHSLLITSIVTSRDTPDTYMRSQQEHTPHQSASTFVCSRVFVWSICWLHVCINSWPRRPRGMVDVAKKMDWRVMLWPVNLRQEFTTTPIIP